MILLFSIIFTGIIAFLIFRGFQTYEAGHKTADEAEAKDETNDEPNTEAPRVPDMTYYPSTVSPVNSLGDFEENMVYQNEADREISTGLRNRLMSQYPMDWSGLPPSSTQFQAGLRETFENAPTKQPVNGNPLLEEMESSSMQPPDTQAMDMAEREALQMYVPRNVADKTTYDIDDARELIHKIYDNKGLIPDVVHDDGSQVYEIVGVRKKDEKIVYEEDEQPATASSQANPSAGEATIHVVPNYISMSSGGDDPFFDEMTRTRRDKWDYTKFTPGLERMFAPTYQTKDWY
jgi:hypothetical protein